MRITTQMLAETSRKTGLPILQGSLLDVLNKKKGTSSNSLLDALNSTKDSQQLSSQQKGYEKLETAAGELALSASKLYAEGEDSLFAKAEESQDTTDIIKEIQTMVESYNKTLTLLKEAGGSLNNFYRQELKNAATENADLLNSVGITQNKDGSLAIDKKKLESADLETLKKVFNSDSDFSGLAAYIGIKSAENAAANASSIMNQYNAKGMSYNDYFESNKYNYFG